ncbi:RAD23 family protein [Oceanibaculum pacificum]|uniref:hypothetical protein n=1 Tax=Oceanibaculum pacificum TaxID=580166 RepID=UPI0012ED165B|nr:hypothetical protein [Oceanibaculum pacificum]
MSSVPPTPPVTGAVQAPSAAVGTAIDPPTSLRNADPGTVVKGTVEGRDRQGNLVIRTDQGAVAVKTPNYIRPGTPVTLEVRATGDSLQVIILSAGRGQGATPPAGPAPLPQPSAPPPAAGQPAPVPGQAVAQPAPGQPVPTGQAPAATPAPTPAATPAPGAAIPAPPSIPPAVTVAGSPALATATQPLQPLQAGQTAQLILLQTAALAPSTPAAPGAPAAAAPATPTPVTPTPVTAPASTATPSPAIPGQAPPAAAAPAGTTPPQATPPQGTPVPPQPGQASAPQLSIGQTPASQIAAGPPAAGPMPAVFTPPSASPQGALTVAASPTQILQALPTGAQIQASVTGIQPPPAAGQPPLPMGLQPLPGGGVAIQASVVGRTAAGQPLLQTPAGLVTVQGAQGLPLGSGVTLGLSPEALRGLEALARGGQPTALPQAATVPGGLGRQWPALQEALAQLAQVNPALAQSVLQSAIPQPGPQLAGALLFVMAAMRGGDLRGLLGDSAVRTLGGRDGRTPLIGRLSDDMGRMSRDAPDSSGQEWRGYYLPMFDGQQLQQIRLFMRGPNDEGEGGEEGGGQGHRFLIDLDLSRLGALQLDGLARKDRLDLIVRTHRRLPMEVRRDIDTLFIETAEQVGLKGQVSFQSTPHFPPLPFVDKSETIEIHGEVEA